MMRKYIYILVSLSLFIFMGCSSDEPISVPGADGRTTLNLLIPSPEMALSGTRADNSAHGEYLATEGKISTLAVIGFYFDEESGSKKHFYTELKENEATAVESVYRSYKIHVVPGSYRLYVLANIPVTSALETRLKSDVTDADLEKDVKAIRYSYSSGLPVPATGLPMSAVLTANVKDNQEKQVIADLKYVCAKVRLTVLYNNAYGNAHPFMISSESVNDLYNNSTVFLTDGATHGTGSSLFHCNASGEHYNLSGELAEKPLSYWTAKPASESSDPLNLLKNGSPLSGTSGWTRFAFQSTIYVPECVNKGVNTSYIQIMGNNGLTANINLGCSSPSSNTHETNGYGNVERGHFYDIVAMVADDGTITYKWNVSEWSLEPLAIQLAGLTELTLARTKISETVSGDSPVEIGYTTTAPRLTFESDKDDLTGLPIFLVTQNGDFLNVNVNSEIGVHSELIKNKGFWVMAGNIRKRVVVETVDLRAFLRLLPTSQTISIRNIANEPKASITFDYATNADGLTINLSAYTNTNTNKTYTTTGGEKGIYLEVCNMDEEAISSKIQLSAGVQIVNLNTQTTYPKNGIIRLTIVDPTQETYFSKQIKGTLRAAVTTSGVAPKTADFTIEPNPTVYTIHFKPKNAPYWQAPHIYVYQPLYYKGYPVYGSSGDDKINWIEYSFTGNMAFKGWESGGGSVKDMTSNYFGTVTDKAQSTFPAYDVLGNWGDPGKPDGYSGNARYDKNINLLGDFQTSCSTCQSSRELLWPGIGMVKETGENDGWWKIELPLLAKPGSAMIMFVCNHGCGNDDFTDRYPKGSYPGIPLPNYADREAWFLYDLTHGPDNCSFSDDKRESYD